MRVPEYDDGKLSAPLVLTYQPCRNAFPWTRFALHWLVRLGLFAAMLFSLQFLPFPKGEWFFGHRPQWILVIDGRGVMIGHYLGLKIRLPLLPTVVIQLFIISATILLAIRLVASWWQRRRRS